MQPTPKELAQMAKLAQSPAAQALLSLLRQEGGDRFQTALRQASAGDYTQAQASLSEVLASREAQELLQQIQEGL